MNRGSLGLLAVALGLVLLAVLAGRLQKKTAREIFGFDPRRMWWYRDIALGTVAAIATAWVVVGIASLLADPTPFDVGLTLVSALVAIVCCEVSPNRALLFCLAVGFVAVQGWIAVAIKGGRLLWIAVPASAGLFVLLRAVGRRPIVER